MMNCKEVQSILSAYIDNECTITQQREINAHLKVCKTCQNELEWLKSIISSTEQLNEIDLPDGFHEDLMNRIHKLENNSSVNKPFKKRIRKTYSIVAAAFLFVVIFSVFGVSQIIKMSNTTYEIAKEETTSDRGIEEYSAEIATEDFIENDLAISANDDDDTNYMMSNQEEAPAIDGLEPKLPDEGNEIMIRSLPESDELMDNDGNTESIDQDQKLVISSEPSAGLGDKTYPSESVDNLKNKMFSWSNIMSILLLILFPLTTIVLIFRNRR